MLKEWKEALEQDCPSPFERCRIIFKAVQNPRTGELDFYTDLTPSMENSKQDSLNVTL